MSIDEACRIILGNKLAAAIIADQGIHWAVVAAMTEAKTNDDPRALQVHPRLECRAEEGFRSMSAEPKHTAGPWKASQTEPAGDWCIHAPSSPWQLAYVMPARANFPAEANAHLIAAAPDLFEVLTVAVEYLELTGAGRGIANLGREALSKARAT